MFSSRVDGSFVTEICYDQELSLTGFPNYSQIPS